MRVHTEPDCTFEYDQPAPLNVKLILLTKDNRVEVGPWKGEPLPNNRTYKGWKGVPGQDRERERALGYV